MLYLFISFLVLALAVVIIHSSAYNAHSKSIPIFFLYLLSRLVSISIHFVPFPIHAWSNRTIRQLALFPLYLRQQQQPSRRRLQRKEIVSRSCWLPIIYLVCVCVCECMWAHGLVCFVSKYESFIIRLSTSKNSNYFLSFPIACWLLHQPTNKMFLFRMWFSLGDGIHWKSHFRIYYELQIRYSYSFHKGYLYLGVRVLQSIHCTLFGIPFLFHSIFFSLG